MNENQIQKLREIETELGNIKEMVKDAIGNPEYKTNGSIAPFFQSLEASRRNLDLFIEINRDGGGQRRVPHVQQVKTL